MITLLSIWQHSGFHVFCGKRFYRKKKQLWKIWRYIIRATFSQERMHYLDKEGKVVYVSKDGRTNKSFPW